MRNSYWPPPPPPPLLLLLGQVFITPMPLLRLMAACGMPHLRNLDEAVHIMRTAMLDVIQVRPTGLFECIQLVGE
jgi:hypothetical protein